ncbi:uncharacterized protein BX663DRAFT_524026 [Cokeromyces recurvatus]|uniref:uncharacterized protein n=1 Tax=Cokeromyces recurvatus TaxID=90255 RepID=UPI002220193A|nr:uncharacterized protein BX663DRAFT_524026 [Cokeromyces recurvatus]KAI7898596.1 hypothetical protein BX663DRAFT_524026 [Cokeromyces recurvatus]
MRRTDEENGHTKASGSQSENASSPTVSSGNDGDHATGSKKEKETHSSPANEPAAKKTTTTAKNNKNGSFNSPTILQGGTFFYIAISVTTFLWITGKAIDIQMNRQERYAEKIANSI